MKFRRIIWIALVAAGTLVAAPPVDNTTLEFHEKGVIVDIQNFFDIAKDQAESYKSLGAGKGELALATHSGIYAFLETPSNDGYLSSLNAGDIVELTGRLLVKGALLHIENVEKLSGDLSINLEGYRSAGGKTISLSGYNLCQCGLDVGELPHSCRLGHLHHLQANDGKIYHYLQYGEAQQAYLGINSHFRPVTVEGRVLPGQYLLVDSVKPR